MTAVRISLVDVYVLRGAGPSLECLVLRRAPQGKRPGTWEAVHGHLDPGEQPADAAMRELQEETGLTRFRLYNLSRVESFYVHGSDEVALVPVFVAFVEADAAVTLSREHDRAEWLPPDQASLRFTWPRARRALEDIVALLGTGDAGLVEDVLRIC